MNLVVDCMQVMSRRPLPFFLQQQRYFILQLFRNCLKNPAISPYRKKLKEIYAHVKKTNEPLRLWKDSEIYHPIDFLSRSRESDYFPYYVELLQILTGIKDIREVEGLPDGHYRLKNLQGTIYEMRDGKLSKRPRDLVFGLKNFKPDIYLPENGMFRDLLVERAYPSMRAGNGFPRLKVKLEKTIRLMKEFSGDVWEDFQEAVWNVVLLPDSVSSTTSSLSLPHRYFGGVFLNAFKNDEYSGVESLVHEYIHLRCTLWWETVLPTGIPDERAYIVSPMTGNRIPAFGMIQAFIIYLSALQFYRYIQSTKIPDDPAVKRRLNQRASHIAMNIPELRRRLKPKVKRGTDMAKLLEYLMEVYGGQQLAAHLL